jgi:AAA domain
MTATNSQYPGLTLRQPPPAAPPPFVVPAEYADIPKELISDKMLLVHRSKVPFGAVSRKAENNPELGATMQEACGALAEGGADGKPLDGLGRYVAPPFVVIDLDKCVDPQTGDVETWAGEIVRSIDSYTESSPSGTGLHIWVRGAKPGDRCRNGIEMYDRGRYLTLTGRHVPATPKEVREVDLTDIYARMLRGDFVKSEQPSQKSSPAITNEPAKIQSEGRVLTTKLELLMHGNIRSSKPFVICDDFGNTANYPSPSEADGALCCILAEKFDGDFAKIDEEFRQSSLYREKWERADYRKATIDSAIAKVKKTPPSSASVQAENKSDCYAPFVTIGQLETGGVRMLVEGFLPEGISMCGALPGVGKTWFALSLAKALTTGQKFLGRFEVKEPIPVLYLIPESSGGAFRARAEKFKIPNDPKLFLCRTVSQGGTLLMNDPAVIEIVKQLRPVVVLDTAVRFNRGSDENSSNSNKIFVDDSLNLIAAGARGVFGLHHATKASRNEGLTQENSLRGSGDLAAMCDSVYGLKRNETLYNDGSGPLQLQVICLKPREFDPPEPFTIAATTKDADGKTISFIDTTGDFSLLDVAELMDDLNGRFVSLVKEDSTLSHNEVAEVLGIKRRRVQTIATRTHYKKVKGRWQERIKIDTSEKAIEVEG